MSNDTPDNPGGGKKALPTLKPQPQVFKGVKLREGVDLDRSSAFRSLGGKSDQSRSPGANKKKP